MWFPLIRSCGLLHPFTRHRFSGSVIKLSFPEIYFSAFSKASRSAIKEEFAPKQTTDHLQLALFHSRTYDENKIVHNHTHSQTVSTVLFTHQISRHVPISSSGPWQGRLGYYKYTSRPNIAEYNFGMTL